MAIPTCCAEQVDVFAQVGQACVDVVFGGVLQEGQLRHGTAPAAQLPVKLGRVHWLSLPFIWVQYVIWMCALQQGH